MTEERMYPDREDLYLDETRPQAEAVTYPQRQDLSYVGGTRARRARARGGRAAR
jgi:hypothetical protein